MYNYIKKWKGDAKKMLLNFKMENFRSFKDETFFTMLSSKQKTHNDYVIVKSITNDCHLWSKCMWKIQHCVGNGYIKKNGYERNLKLQRAGIL